ncbi:glycosyltransferase family 4 protein [Swaminathania salitolerans]|uniref:Glycosyl transferase family 1 n=1 Tax=Swaminathania salitolerans TaxID=182838 RepID=A0A511BRK7_9PROT|nr:glycosyltransferase family 4 protein [Swaminathania salitolerans]GBQ14202.1 glycosyltransferase [Swaminathania salitolerans LMG 21291]GEL02949.1 glycosyl transferase family 1 [Swaminathania salitolerans]
MRFLFVHQNFPGQFLHLVRHLHEQGDHEIVFISEANEGHLPGVRRVLYRQERKVSPETHPSLRELETGLLRAEAVARAANTLKGLGYTPDIIIGHHGWGELLNLVDVYPSTPILGYFEFFYHTDRNDVNFDPEFPPYPALFPSVRVKNAINLLALNLGQHGQTPTLFQKSTYPEWAHAQITLLREGVNLDLCAPEPGIGDAPLAIGPCVVQPNEKLITFVARNLEPYRGIHSFLRALPRVLAERPDARVVLIGGDGTSYGAPPPQGAGSWRDLFLGEVSDRIDPDRVHFLGKVEYDLFRTVLKRSDAHVYLTYPFVASWSLREAMATGCPIVGSRTAPVEEFVTDRRSGLLVPFTEPDSLADAILELLEDEALSARLGSAARHFAEEALSLGGYLENYDRLIERIVNA